MTGLRSILLLSLIFALNQAAPNYDVDAALGICLEAKFHQPPLEVERRCCIAHYDAEYSDQSCYDRYVVFSNKGAIVNTSNFANCIFIKKKFTKGDENLNFKRIRNKLRELPDPKERKFRMKMYEECNISAKMALIKVQRGDLPKGVRRPFYLLVYLCIINYSSSVSCPYYVWLSNDSVCLEAKSECEKLVDFVRHNRAKTKHSAKQKN